MCRSSVVMIRWFRLLVAVTLTLIPTRIGCIVSASSSTIVPLTDLNFEHQTQASTGMTTGSWLVLFHADRCSHCRALMTEFEKLAMDEQVQDEARIVLASVNVLENKQTCNRFGIRGFPTILFLHQHGLYYYKGPRNYSSIKDFVLNGGFQSMDPLPIPSPPSPMDYYVQTIRAMTLELFDAAKGNQGMVGYAILAMVLMLFGIFGGILFLCLAPPVKTKEEKHRESVLQPSKKKD